MDMKTNQYTPTPVDTSDVTLPAELMALAEQIAQNVHEVWAAGRIAEGWTYGEVHDYVRKTHPSLVPYEQLSEAEKDYDRRTSQQTLRLIRKLGFRIETDA